MEKDQKLIDLISGKTVLKQKVYQKTKNTFSDLKSILSELIEEMKVEIDENTDEVRLSYSEKGAFECQAVVGGDTLIFHMHTNVFLFDKWNPVWQTSYLKEDEGRGYCGVINVYNFLSDSFKYNRERDLGYLIARVFVNSEGHYKVEGQRLMNAKHNDFVNRVINKAYLKEIICDSVRYALDFDLLVPPYEHVKEASVHEMNALEFNHRLQTGKRLGYTFATKDEPIQ